MNANQPSQSINVMINGVAETLEGHVTISELLILKQLPINAIAVVVNDEVLPRSRWNHVMCQHDDSICVFSAVAGG
ncbi:sulfur carrier protein ThiS [Shewanella sp. MF05960]